LLNSDMPVKKVTKIKETEKKITPEKGGFSVDVLNLKGKSEEKMELPAEIFGQKMNHALLAQAVRVSLANKRQGTSSTKDRGEVAGSTRKVYAQKGTGRARHGSIKAPIYVGGGIVFGPHPRDFSLKFPQKMKAKALFQTLSDKLEQKNLYILEAAKSFEGKTSVLFSWLKDLSLEIRKQKLKNPTLLVTAKNEGALQRAGKNIKNLSLTPPALLNPYQVLSHKTIIFTKEALGDGLKLWSKK